MVDRLQTKLELTISCRKLPSKDLLSKSDPMVVVKIRDSKRSQMVEVGRTEFKTDEHNPDFEKSFILDYFFEENQELLFEVFDVDDDKGSLDSADFLGQAQCQLGAIVAAPGGTLIRPLLERDGQPLHKHSTIILHVEQASNSSHFIRFVVQGTGLDKKDLFTSDPYLEFYRYNGDGNPWTLFHTTEVHGSTLEPHFAPMTFKMSTFCGGDLNRPILIKCWDEDTFSANDFIGECQVTVSELITGQLCRKELINPKKQAKKPGYVNSGSLIFQPATVWKDPTFLDYIAGGCQISLMAAIDFTGSNRNPSDYTSLHYRAKPGGNEYQNAISMIGSIVAPYDSDQWFPMWGFGARIRMANGAEQTSHCFPLTFDPSRPEVRGVQGMLDAYNNALNNVVLSGPTYFSEILSTAEGIVSSQANGAQCYTVLLIITDGLINDMDRTIACLVRLSRLPISVIIVGVGDADFTDMDRLDGDGGLLHDMSGTTAERDIVQFVPFRKFPSAAELARETLKEVPDQFMRYMKKRNISPNPPRQALPNEIKEVEVLPSAAAMMAPVPAPGPAPIMMAPAGPAPIMMAPAGPAPIMMAPAGPAPVMMAPAPAPAPAPVMMAPAHAPVPAPVPAPAPAPLLVQMTPPAFDQDVPPAYN